MKIKVCEIFESIQGEGKYLGYPMLFIRTSGCTRKCSFCDTKYHTKGKDITLTELIRTIKRSKLDNVCWTGGEPLLWREEIIEVIRKTWDRKKYHLETNGDLIAKLWDDDLGIQFTYIAVSPKEKLAALRTQKELNRALARPENTADIKVVTDLETIGLDLIRYATMLMPLTTYNKEKDSKIFKKVWDYCVQNNIKFTPRLQTAFGKKRGI